MTPGPNDNLRHTKVRHLVLVYASSLSLILYLDRICMAEAAGTIAGVLGLGDIQRGMLFTAFTIGYALFEVPTGAWGDRYGPKRVLCRIVLWWSAFTALTGCIWRFTWDSGYHLYFTPLGIDIPLLFDGFLLLLLIRFLFGAGEAGAYPNVAKCTSQWFPLHERGRAQGVVITAGRLGGALAPGLTIGLTYLVNRFLWPDMGWRVAFWVYGLLGVLWVYFFARWYRNSPTEHPAVNAAELALIQEGKTLVVSETSAHANVPWRVIFKSVNLWAYCLMGFSSALVVYLYFTWFPNYLEDRHHLPKLKWGWVAGMPMMGGAVGSMLGGFLTDWLVRRTGSRRCARAIMGMAGKGGGAVFLLAGALVDHPVAAVILITLSAFSSDLSVAAQWAIGTDCGGRFVATVFGFMNSFASIGGALSPLLIGFILDSLAPRDAAGFFDTIAREHAWNVVLYVLAGILVLCALTWFRINAEESMVA